MQLHSTHRSRFARSGLAAVLAYCGAAAELLPWGDFEELAGQTQVIEEQGNHHLRLHCDVPGTLVSFYREIQVPHGVQALELRWRQRVTGLARGDKPWFDARILMEFKDKAGQKLPGSPSPPYSQKDTKGWVERHKAFLVPEGADRMSLMPCLFNVKAGTYDLDDLELVATDPAPLIAARETRARQEAAKQVPDEEPVPDRWPSSLRVEGNRVVDREGNAVWLQGVNAGGLETHPHDPQPVKSLVVAIDEWKANCVRVPVKEDLWWGKSAYQTDGGEGYRALVDKMVRLAANRGAYLVIDLHRFRAPKPEHAAFWQEVATRYKDHPAVLFDVFNEPHGISWEVWRNGGWVGEKAGADESAFLTDEEKRKNQGFESVGMQGLVDAVRSTGARNPIIAGGVFWCNDLSGILDGYALDDKGGNGILYSWHTYNWHPGWERILPFAAKHPIFLGEVGADVEKMAFIPEADQEDPATWVPDMLGFIQTHGLHWTAWCFHPRATPRLLLDWDYTPTPFWGVPTKEALAGKRFPLTHVR